MKKKKNSLGQRKHQSKDRRRGTTIKAKIEEEE
jgi:hypothetical protein